MSEEFIRLKWGEWTDCGWSGFLSVSEHASVNSCDLCIRRGSTYSRVLPESNNPATLACW